MNRNFYGSYKQIAPELLDRVIEALNTHPTASILFTGYSLGGALATFAAVDVKENFNLTNREVLLYTFGSPRIGNQAWADYVMKLFPGNETLFRVVNGKDRAA